MGIFSRMGDIINSNINAMLDKAEDPEKMIRLMIQEMEDTLVDLKSSCAAKMAARKEMERDKNTLAEQFNRWEKRALLAVEHQRDDLAREALLEKKQCAADLQYAEENLAHYNTLIEECRSNISKLESKLEEVVQKHKLLIQRGIHAMEKKRARMAMSQADGARAMMRFDSLESRIERMEAEADLTRESSQSDTLEREFSRLESDGALEEELAALKKAVKDRGKGQGRGSAEKSGKA